MTGNKFTNSADKILKSEAVCLHYSVLFKNIIEM
jgi:hypothetical protein